MRGKKFLTFDLYGFGAPYLIMQDCKEALRELGHESENFSIQMLWKASKEEIKKQIVKSGAELIFTINHIGFTPNFLLAIQELEIPYISWFIDNPFFRVNSQILLQSVSPHSILFTVEKIYIEKIKELGFKWIFYLPVAVNEKIFHKCDFDEIKEYRCDVSFTGASMYPHYKSYYEEEISEDQKINNVIRRVIEIQSQNPLLEISTILTQVQKAFGYEIKFESLKWRGREPLQMCLEEAALSVTLMVLTLTLRSSGNFKKQRSSSRSFSMDSTALG